MAVVEAATLKDYDAAVGSKTCVFFWAAWHEPSKPGGQMDEVSRYVVCRAKVLVLEIDVMDKGWTIHVLIDVMYRMYYYCCCCCKRGRGTFLFSVFARHSNTPTQPTTHHSLIIEADRFK